MSVRPPHPQNERFPRLAQLLAAYLIGDMGFEGDLDGYIRAVDDEALHATVAEVRARLAEPSDDELTDFVASNSAYLVDGSGRRTLEAVLSYLDDAIRNPKPRHWLAPRAPTLTRLLYEHTRSREDLRQLVQAGARAMGPEAARAARQEITSLLEDPSLSEDDLGPYVAVHSYWLIDNVGRKTLEQVAAALDAASRGPAR